MVSDRTAKRRRHFRANVGRTGVGLRPQYEKDPEKVAKGLMANIAGASTVAADGDPTETITDIQNYLQSFNKEIGEASGTGNEASSAGTTTFYTIDTSQVLASTGSQEDSANTATTTTTVATNSETGEATGYPTLAIVPDSESGAFVLIVHQAGGQTPGQVQIPVTAAVSAPIVTSGSQSTLALPSGISVAVPTNITTTPATVGLSTESETRTEKRNSQNSVLTRIKKEKLESEKPNDISVYDFDDVNPPHQQEMEEDIDEEEEEAEANETEDLDQREAGNIKQIGTPKGKRSGKKSPGGVVKKNKFSTPTTPTGSNQHMCNYCNYTSSKRYLLSRHMKSHSEERPHKCGICERGFKTIASLQNHVNTHTGVRPHGCKYCEAAFTTSGELVRHVRYRHTHEKPHRCTECDYASVELSKLKRHMRCHTGERPYQCPHCTYASPDTYKLKRHLRIHTGEKPYECDVCHARFTQSNSLKAHRLIHSGNKPIFKCDLCPTTCGRKTDLRIHVQKLHTSDKPLTCKRCDQSFPDRYSFKIHLKSHEGEKCFKCDLCNYASVSARHLESHMLIHTDQKPFQCEECEQSFRQKQLLKRHKNLYHNPEYIPPQPKEKTHECPHCNKAFRHKGNLMRHLVCHDPDAYKDSAGQISRINDTHQLIDDEEESDESSQIILPNTDDDTIDPQTLQFALDPQTQQMLQGEQVVVFEVVQLNNTEGSTGDDTRSSFSNLDPALLESTPISSKASKSVKTQLRAATLRNATLLTSNGASSSGTDNIIIQLQAEDEEAANSIQTDNVIDDSDYVASNKPVAIAQLLTNQTQQTTVSPPPCIYDENKQLREQLQKQKDLADCFGFKDDDEEDEAILSMPAAHAQ
ncbi:Zinc-finger double domain containing protein 12-like protein [Dinothrombium tinctorium]|uniref:CCCTC-binding factor n=1 Tax=Dinothrombium tinctorium TaxID=1965070 RepID=A0A3S3Q787_9ACAR|nr:Zinc-finger double domain containing protein 12-like protein [Dinothrombium tinctorium]RWS04676.1 Zinc-finger double domain containing protein 12-like protein [Dinothrombium tinctorium]